MLINDQSNYSTPEKFSFGSGLNINKLKTEDEIMDAYEFLEQHLTAMKH